MSGNTPSSETADSNAAAEGSRTTASDTGPGPSAAAEAFPARTTVRDAYLFFLPLLMMAEMMMVSHSIIHAFLARLPNPQATLAAYNVAFSFHSIAGSPIWSAVLTCIAFISDQRSMRRLLVFFLWVSLVITTAGWAVGLTPLGLWLFHDLIGASAPVARSAQYALLIFMLIPPVTVMRSLSYALLMKNRRTVLITIGTFVRLLALAGFLGFLPRLVEGPAVGALALLLCITVESLLAVAVAYRFYQALPATQGAAFSYRDVWRFAWPLMIVQGSENGVAFSTNFFLGRLTRPDLSLAAFGVMDGLQKLLLGPLRNLAQTAQTLVRTAEDHRVIVRFAVQVVGVFAALSLLFYLAPVRTFVLERVMGLTPDLAATIAPALLFFFALSMVLGCSALLRGFLLAARRTGYIAISGGMRLIAVLLLGSLALVFPTMNGAVLGVFVLIAGFGTEAGVLGLAMFRGRRGAAAPEVAAT